MFYGIERGPMAIICISDPLRPEAVEVMKMLRRVGFQNLVMMTETANGQQKM